jgi:hypothetical protein
LNLAYFSSRSFSVGFNKSYIVFYATCGRRRKFAQKLALKAYLAEYTKPAENLSVEPCKSVLIRVKKISVVSESSVAGEFLSAAPSGGLACPCKQLAGVRRRRIYPPLAVLILCFIRF